MIRGEFIRGDGLVIPNNITDLGVAIILEAALRNAIPEFWLGLCKAVPQTDLEIVDVKEPTVADGYERKEIERSAVGWESSGTLNGEYYLETKQVTWTPTAAFDQVVSRIMLASAATAGTLIALSSQFPAELTMDAATPLAIRQYRYRLYLR